MTTIEIARVCSALSRGAKMLVGRDHSGRQKLKLVRGPFGLFVKRYECSEDDLEQIKRELAKLQAKKTAGKMS